MDTATEKHIQEVQQWLDDNVKVFEEPRNVTLSEFEIDWETFSGAFRVTLDAISLSDKLAFSLEASGKTTFFLTMFHSPLGAPASYSAIEISEKTHAAILKGLWQTIPRLKGAGRDRDTGKEITIHTPPHQRIDARILSAAKHKVDAAYSIQVAVKQD